ncbi:regulatory LuxR family protein [Serratia fonticola]|uniref:Regulatory LuxR family protein n=1 Tax=Serratia fonticola TaxID=47917 RepID=A0A559T431_SERFO|nr:LuxR C-terminal-related transcriptional regulator [Serratia fonticola]TQI78144.1 regulatory LuxR family protein [Serratia fonticola]TQI94858.1 regulatory LuxR family protein [Serratia fonticola]TVZ69356.1 regulatory LuxR family protein [Serratia fonticola]
MIIIKSNYPCPLSNVSFKQIIDELNTQCNHPYNVNDCHIDFIDGDSTKINFFAKQVYLKRKKNMNVFMVTLASKMDNYSPVINHLSDIVVSKNVDYDTLKKEIEKMLNVPPKAREDLFFGDIWGDILNQSQKEYKVLELLFKGYSQNQIAKMLNLSVKTISGYKVRAVKRHGLRNFNELYMRKFNNELNRHIIHEHDR